MVCDSYNNCLLSHFNGQKNIHCTTVFAIIESEVCVSGTDVHLRFDFIHKYFFSMYRVPSLRRHSIWWEHSCIFSSLSKNSSQIIYSTLNYIHKYIYFSLSFTSYATILNTVLAWSHCLWTKELLWHFEYQSTVISQIQMYMYIYSLIFQT